ncbi:O-antigen ligase family protein [Microbacterium trichothecenolyticum]|uniref:O-antigen ligase-related domain-containing protein n=1 Tax=Microbacterium trichothecenolyticum TaxID=69370 RepID=A0A0M2H8B5_MICTR|nr:O-antigen ligase family protein [Microbacterium trichothecenolyticum]KJL40340.1 hypothetical protein RS82_03669 [Microbacterium trichothecenolyticum]
MSSSAAPPAAPAEIVPADGDAPPAAGPPAGRVRVVLGAIALAAIAIAAAVLLPPLIGGALLLTVALLYLARRIVFSWVGGLGILVAVVMFIPVRRYALPIPLPFQLEPYRVVLILLLLAVAVALVLDRGRRWQPVAFGWPIGIFVATLVISIPANGTALVEQGLASTAVGALLNYAILLSAFYIVRQLLTTERIVMGLATALVWCGVAVALFAVFERVTRVNVFWRLATFLPLDMIADEGSDFRAGGYRSYASSQHPIALSVMLCILIPLAIYLAVYAKRPVNGWSRRIVYGLAAAALLMGVLAAVSRTAVVVLAIMTLMTLILRPYLGLTLIALALPTVVIGFLALPKVFDTLFASFLDLDALIASQKTSPGWGGAGRLADLEPALAQVAVHPFFGTGVGSRIVVGEERNAFILDNQFLGTLMEVGAVGVLGLVALVVVPTIMLLRFSFITARTEPRYAFLAFALSVSAAGYTAALFFYDAFGFYQTVFVFFFLLAIGAWLLTASPPALAANAMRRDAASTRQSAPPVIQVQEVRP